MIVLLGAAIGLQACGSSNLLGKRQEGDSFAGGAVADEPSAALAARDMLAAGGSAADAAVAASFTLAVSLPSSAGLGGGGSCLVWEKAKKAAQLLDMIEPAAPHGDVASPMLARLLFALHARYGRQPWAQAVSPAEQLARFPQPISRAQARELAVAPAAVLRVLAEQRLFVRADGGVLEEGQPSAQVQLAATLGQIRARGAGVLYTGPVARELAQASAGKISLEMLSQTRPRWREPAKVGFGDSTAYFTMEPERAGMLAARLLALLGDGKSYEETPEAERPHLLAEAMALAGRDLARDQMSRAGAVLSVYGRDQARSAMASYRADRHASADSAGAEAPMPAPPIGSTSLVVTDRDGLTVACALSMNAPFGTGRALPGFGFLTAPAEPKGEAAAAAVMVGTPDGDLLLAGASSGGSPGAAALDQVALGVLADHLPVDRSIARPRLWHSGDADVLYDEALPAAIEEGLRRRGHRLLAAPALGRVNALACPIGMARAMERCRLEADPRSNGIWVGGG